MSTVTNVSIEDRIDERIGEVRTDALDMSFGEILSLFEQEELIIQPEYQRLLRWSPEQRSRLIESILLNLPIPQIFVIENPDGVFELIDGLQRVGSVVQFAAPGLLHLEPLVLQGCGLVRELNGQSYEDLPVRLRLNVRRSKVRMVVIGRQSKPELRYEMFKRLNTGGALLSPQEIRNCTARIAGEPGVTFYGFLQTCAELPAFATCTLTISDEQREQRGVEELVLRFFAGKNALADFGGSVREWLDNYMESVVLRGHPFDYATEREVFEHLFGYLAEVLDTAAFVQHTAARQAVGGLKPAYFEAVSIGVLNVLEEARRLDQQAVREAIITATQSPAFRESTGPGANTKPKLRSRIGTIEEAIRGLLP